MLNSNWKALIASNKVQVGVAGANKKRKLEGAAADGSVATATASDDSTATAAVTPCLAIDCEFVGIGPEGAENALARVSIVNFHGAVVYDRYVKVGEPVTDYRTAVSGIRPQHLHGKNSNAVSFKQCQREVAALVENKILVGHAVHNDLTVLLLSHPKHLIRDTARYKGLCPDRPRSLKKLVAEHLHTTIQSGEHNSIEDARATLALYKLMRVKWEKEIYDKMHGKRTHTAPNAAAAAPSAAASTADDDDVIPTAVPAASSTSVAAAAAPHKRKHAEMQTVASTAARAAKEEKKVERNLRRKLMRKEQKQAKHNR